MTQALANPRLNHCHLLQQAGIYSRIGRERSSPDSQALGDYCGRSQFDGGRLTKRRAPFQASQSFNGQMAACLSRVIKALRQAHGGYIIYLDDDDRLMHEAVAFHMQAIEGKSKPGLILAAIRGIEMKLVT